MADVKLSKGDYFLGQGDQVLVRKTELVDSLVRSSSEVLKSLSTISPVTLDKISIDPTGNIIIADPAFRAAVDIQLNSPSGAGTNAVAICMNGHCEDLAEE